MSSKLCDLLGKDVAKKILSAQNWPGEKRINTYLVLEGELWSYGYAVGHGGFETILREEWVGYGPFLDICPRNVGKSKDKRIKQMYIPPQLGIRPYSRK